MFMDPCPRANAMDTMQEGKEERIGRNARKGKKRKEGRKEWKGNERGGEGRREGHNTSHQTTHTLSLAQSLKLGSLPTYFLGRILARSLGRSLLNTDQHHNERTACQKNGKHKLTRGTPHERGEKRREPKEEESNEERQKEREVERRR
jgi:hypothetical protein